MKYQKKPVIVEAYKTDREMEIQTLEGTMHASVGDYIITGVNGEQYPCKPDIFAKTYELLLKTKSADEIAAERRQRFIDGEKLSSKIAGHSYYHGDAILSKIGIMMEGKDTGNSVRPANVIAVVRCRECRHRDPEDHKCDCGQNERQGCPFPVDDDYFCKYGARREWGDDDE